MKPFKEEKVWRYTATLRDVREFKSVRVDSVMIFSLF